MLLKAAPGEPGPAMPPCVSLPHLRETILICSGYSLRNMDKCISASSQVRKLVSLYTAIKHYHTGKVASSVVMEAQQAAVVPPPFSQHSHYFWEVAQKLGV